MSRFLLARTDGGSLLDMASRRAALTDEFRIARYAGEPVACWQEGVELAQRHGLVPYNSPAHEPRALLLLDVHRDSVVQGRITSYLRDVIEAGGAGVLLMEGGAGTVVYDATSNKRNVSSRLRAIDSSSKAELTDLLRDGNELLAAKGSGQDVLVLRQGDVTKTFAIPSDNVGAKIYDLARERSLVWEYNDDAVFHRLHGSALDELEGARGAQDDVRYAQAMEREQRCLDGRDGHFATSLLSHLSHARGPVVQFFGVSHFINNVVPRRLDQASVPYLALGPWL